jgi:hypothetical protein
VFFPMFCVAEPQRGSNPARVPQKDGSAKPPPPALPPPKPPVCVPVKLLDCVIAPLAAAV